MGSAATGLGARLAITVHLDLDMDARLDIDERQRRHKQRLLLTEETLPVESSSRRNQADQGLRTSRKRMTSRRKGKAPVILEPADYGAWLDPARGGAELLRPCPEEWLEAVPVSTRVNSPGNDDETIIQPSDEALPVQRTLI